MGENRTQPFAPFLPLTFTQNSWQYSTILDEKNNAICRLDLEDWGVTEDNQNTLEALQEQYAAFIVKACNAHADLIAALEFIRDGYANQDVNHVDYRVKVYQVALDALEKAGKS